MPKPKWKAHLTCGGNLTLCQRITYKGKKRLVHYFGDDSLFTDVPIKDRCKICQVRWDQIVRESSAKAVKFWTALLSQV